MQYFTDPDHTVDASEPLATCICRPVGKLENHMALPQLVAQHCELAAQHCEICGAACTAHACPVKDQAQVCFSLRSSAIDKEFEDQNK